MITQGDWLLTPARAAVHLPTTTAVVADLHLGYAESRQRRGDAIPTRNLSSLLEPLTHLFRELKISNLVIAGDLFQAGVDTGILEQLENWIDEEDITLQAVIPGNHDRGLQRLGDRLPIQEKAQLGEWTVVHGDEELPKGSVAQGHVHPCLRLQGHSLTCFLMSDTHLILPAFSPDAAGVNIRGKDEWAGYRRFVILGHEVKEVYDRR